MNLRKVIKEHVRSEEPVTTTYVDKYTRVTTALKTDGVYLGVYDCHLPVVSGMELVTLNGKRFKVGGLIEKRIDKRYDIVVVEYIDQNDPETTYLAFNCRLTEEDGLNHVDDFVESYSGNEDKYARWVIFLMRMPASLYGDFLEWVRQYKLFCTYDGKRYRVTGASRMGDLMLSSNFERSRGYDVRVGLRDCSEWSNKP